MGEPFIGEIRMFGGNFAPQGWAFCQGQTIAISQNDALFTLIGTTYGGDGQSTFNLPNLQGRLPIHQGQGPGITQSYVLGETGGTEEVTLTVQQIPNHNHALVASTSNGTQIDPANNVLGNVGSADLFVEDAPTTNLATTAVQPVGGSQPHSNLQQYLCISFIISLFGIFPSQN